MKFRRFSTESLKIENEGISGRTIKDNEGEDVMQFPGISKDDEIDIEAVDSIHKHDDSEVLEIHPETQWFRCTSKKIDASEHVKANKLECDGDAFHD